MAITAEAKATIFNKSASMATIVYTNWDESTSRSVVVPAGTSFVTHNWHEANSVGVQTAVTENVLNLPIQDTNPLVKVLIQDFAYDKNKVSVTLDAGTYTL